MKVLIVAFWFPPSNFIGAIRVGKLARYLDRRGYEVRVLTTDIGEDRSVPLEIPRERVICTEYRQRRDRLAPWVRRFRRYGARATNGDADRATVEMGEPATQRWGAAPRASLWELLRNQYYGLRHIPDRRRDWVSTAVPAGIRLIEDWKPDLMFASAPPFTGLIVASRLSRACKIPWIADFRDLWVDNPYYSEPGWRRPIDALLEWRTVREAAALVTVSPTWAEQLRRRHGKATEVVYNGYAEEDFPQTPPRDDRGSALTIRYTGTIYRGFRDPSAVFAAIALLPDPLRDRVSVEFFGDAGDDVVAMAAKHRVEDRVAVRPRVPYRRALELQMQADVLLLLQWCDKRDEGNLPGKLFEYLCARRPILFIGYEKGIAAQIITERGAGLVSNTPEQIRNQLQEWIEAKDAGRLSALGPSVKHGLSREEQFGKLESLFAAVVNDRSVATRS
jgi:hypothetical protein